MIAIFIIVFSFLLSVFLVHSTQKMAIVYGWHDVPDNRKVHHEKIPTMGGLAIIISLWASLFILDIFRIFEFSEIMYKIFAVNIAFLIVGIIDDVHGVSARIKLIIQIIVGGMFYLWITNNSIILFNNLILTNIIFVIISMLYFALIVNSINFIDGLDGLSGGVSIIFSIVLFYISISLGNDYIAYIHIALIGSLLGFLIFNFYPAKIFMGDTGSLFLGSIYALSSIILGYFIREKWIIFIVLFTYPLTDVFLAILRRLKFHRGLFAPDDSHIHHILQNKFHSQKKAVLIIYFMNIVYAIITLMFYKFFNIYVFVIYLLYTFSIIIYFFIKMNENMKRMQ